MAQETDYSAWSQEELIDRVNTLEAELTKSHLRTSISTSKTLGYIKKPSRADRTFDPSRYNTRLIALKLAYLGKNYNGYEYHAGHATPLPTIEEKLWEALNKARFIFPEDVDPTKPGEVNWQGCEYTKCGRTDKGVSAFGQVVGIRLRSNRPIVKRKMEVQKEDLLKERITGDEVNAAERQNLYNTYPREGGMEVRSLPLSSPPASVTPEAQHPDSLDISDSDKSESLAFDPIVDEISYPQVLNRLLPPDIRILAWCPNPPLDFSARFSCRERRYKYYFTQPAFLPIPNALEHADGSSTTTKDGWLDIEAMRDAASRFEGRHDFRNFCKVDPKKQIWNYERDIFHAGIEEVENYTSSLEFLNGDDFVPSSTRPGQEMESSYPKVYTFTLHGSSFLWHQVRHMVAILFLIGQGLEEPGLVSELLDIEKTPSRPIYEVAADTPLVLWDCIFPLENDAGRKDAMEWHYIGQSPDVGQAKYGNGAPGAGLMDELWRGWRERKVDELLAGDLMGVVANQDSELGKMAKKVERRRKSQKVFDGAEGPRAHGRYVKVMDKKRLENIEVLNMRFARKQGYETSEALKAAGFKRLNIEKREEVVDEAVER